MRSSAIPPSIIVSPSVFVLKESDPLTAALKGSTVLPRFKLFEMTDWAAETTILSNLKDISKSF